MKKCSCSSCERKGELIPFAEFTKNKNIKDGYHHYCKRCKRVSDKKGKIVPLPIPPKGFKICISRECKSGIVPISEFWNNKNTKDKLQHKCVECMKAENKIDYSNNKKKFGYGVYIIIHKPTQSYYVGEGFLHSRKTEHFGKLKSNKHHILSFQRLYNNNIDEFEFKIIKKWKKPNYKGKLIEDELIREGFRNNSSKILNLKNTIERKELNDVAPPNI